MDELNDYSLIKAEYQAGYRVARVFVWFAWLALAVELLLGLLAILQANVLAALVLFLTAIFSCIFLLAGAAVLRAVLDTAAAARAIMLRGHSGPTSIGDSEVEFFARTGKGPI